MEFFSALQLTGLGLFFGLAAYRSARLRRRARLNAIAPGRASRLALTAFALTWCWALLVLWYALPAGGRTLAAPVDARLWECLPLRLVGIGIICAGLAINLLAHIALGDNWRLGIDERHPGALVTSGIYSRSRHPIYLFFQFYLSGTFLVEPRSPLALLGIAIGLVLHCEALREERFLEEQFGKEYRRYRSRVRRYWGRTAAES